MSTGIDKPDSPDVAGHSSSETFWTVLYRVWHRVVGVTCSIWTLVIVFLVLFVINLIVYSKALSAEKEGGPCKNLCAYILFYMLICLAEVILLLGSLLALRSKKCCGSYEINAMIMYILPCLLACALIAILGMSIQATIWLNKASMGGECKDLSSSLYNTVFADLLVTYIGLGVPLLYCIYLGLTKLYEVISSTPPETNYENV
eukprot:TRINITY_DN9101_c0_g1_i1.p1 TRINITY_DN9101_c0_g1~~TRINITY_DN9101_c0_g1_i1.p1  ORF type:complete len:203 (+),score=36.29 TRINITY_DN9101_c0_g1_i1:95-703(+)